MARKGKRKLEVWLDENHPIFGKEYHGKRSKIVRDLLNDLTSSPPPLSPTPPKEIKDIRDEVAGTEKKMDYNALLNF